jgi:hypothetical protein
VSRRASPAAELRQQSFRYRTFNAKSGIRHSGEAESKSLWEHGMLAGCLDPEPSSWSQR